MKNLLIVIFIFSGNYLISQSLPAYFDLRTSLGANYVSSVKSQQGGTCWTHGAFAAMEGNLLMTGKWAQAGEQGEPNLAEYHLDWWNGFNQHNNDDVNPTTGNGLSVHNGGDYRVTSAYLSRGEGAVRDIDAPGFNSAPLRNDSTYHYFYARTIEWYTAGPDLERINTIKQKVINYGVVGTCMCVGFWNTGNIHYQPPTDNTDPNHAVAIIGWNDTIQTPAKDQGAWLVKNSWGSSWGNNGYFWISYYDRHCGQEPQMGAISFQEVEPMKYSKVYYHDYHGWRAELPNCTEAFNAFKSNNFEKLEAVSFFNAADSIQYEIVVFDTYSNGQLLDTLSKKSGNIYHTGFHTFNLDSAVNLSPNQNFFIYIKLSSGGHPIDKTSEVPVLLGGSSRTIVTSKSSSDQSFYKYAGGNWQDLHSLDSTANFCIKGLANPILPVKSATPTGDTSLCKGQNTKTYKITSTKFASTYNWVLNPANAGNITSQDTSITIIWNSAFSGKAKLSVFALNPNGQGAESEKLDITIHENPQVNIGNDTIIEEPNNLTLASNNSFSNYLWSNGSTFDTCTYFGYILGKGTHQIWLNVSDSNACKNTDTLQLTVIPGTSVEENPLSLVSIYPIPAEDKLFLCFKNNSLQCYEIEIFTQSGQKVFYKKTKEAINQIIQLDISDLQSGIYSLRISVGISSFTKKIIVK